MPSIRQDHLECSPQIRSGKPCITGTRIAVEDIATMHLKLGDSLVEIAGNYRLSLASVYAAMAYYFEHREEIDLRTISEDQQVEALRQQYPSQLQTKLSRLRQG